MSLACGVVLDLLLSFSVLSSSSAEAPVISFSFFMSFMLPLYIFSMESFFVHFLRHTYTQFNALTLHDGVESVELVEVARAVLAAPQSKK
eukprot:6710118-Ditylum_brightwellii.AAC.1